MFVIPRVSQKSELRKSSISSKKVKTAMDIQNEMRDLDFDGMLPTSMLK